MNLCIILPFDGLLIRLVKSPRKGYIAKDRLFEDQQRFLYN